MSEKVPSNLEKGSWVNWTKDWALLTLDAESKLMVTMSKLAPSGLCRMRARSSGSPGGVCSSTQASEPVSTSRSTGGDCDPVMVY